jgi:hypothetical protein
MLTRLLAICSFILITGCLSSAAEAEAGSFAVKAVQSGDTKGWPFAIIDKVAATMSIHDSSGKLIATTVVLTGQSKGDQTVPGIGDRPIALIAEHERTTPAGRFISERGTNLNGEDVIWIDYSAAVSIHRLRRFASYDERARRLKSSTPLDNRATYGCVNVPEDFYVRWVEPTLGRTRSIIYILPEEQPHHQVFEFLK